MEVLHQRCAGLDVHKKNVVASVRLAGPYRPRPAEHDLYIAIRLIGRGPFTGRPPRGVLLALKEAAAVEGASLRELGQADARRILRGRGGQPGGGRQVAVRPHPELLRAGLLGQRPHPG